ncbi:hypothetical protein [Lysobacter niastensis]|uniref:Uncharacterized protein n=1 Tax=Lysobacter niastensis TaxID=380629 RepID=A0ABS0B8L1_9GAMM|nr:hypothetical protein [Lysobacter niastensis]MBF6025348.1 hypothetical protein [Lysobacter niastensis]
MSILLMPRLTSLGVSAVLESAGSVAPTPEGAKAILEDGASMRSFAASGGNRAEELAWNVGAALREIAINSGFPGNPSQVARSKFDREAAIYLAAHPDLATGEALRDDVWAYIATIVVPDLVAWRFPDRGQHRFEGGVRNALQRLWSRGTVLDRGEHHVARWGLVQELSEDAAVQIFERASIAGNRPLAVALAECWVRMAGKIGRGNMEDVMRRATKLIRLRNEIVDLAGLPAAELDTLVASSFDLAWESISADSLTAC